MTDMGSGRNGTSSRFAWPLRRRTPAGPEGTAEDIAVQDVAEREAVDRRLPPPEPEPLLDPPPRFHLAMFRLAALGLALVLGLALTLVRVFGSGPPSVADLRAQSGVDTWTVLPIGVKDDQPGTAIRDENGVWSGFDIDIAYMIAEDLGFRRDDVRFYGMESEDRARMQAVDLKGNRVPVKLVIASYSITADREARKDVTFSEPYLFTEQSVLTLKGHPKVATFRDLKGETVCSLSTATSTGPLQDLKIDVVSRNRMRECIDDLRKGRVTAVSTDAAILAGFKDRNPGEFEHWDVGSDKTESYGVNVGENEALKKLVDLTLYRSYYDPADGRWEEAYQKNLQSETKLNGKVPIAIATQPRPARPEIRELPWEEVFR
ncbi:transporter substrate-binding domain-containing protein [Paractinoplanes lichenicola]|uniref:Transporter substrate-binding domain-containing protein n=1 Tax=Paractinoplanes lichenicola TaxID=2802976 RepID=A0ABS1VIA2_9ACTN|nr:transporter substrate-binding domain-containing protein [Actinoplanes lichenicola]MBL7254438.1 transporter substrate-binding domain-containing protein [Actinoplanes lichenicola]